MEQFIKRKGLFLGLDDFKIIEAFFREFEYTSDPTESLSESEKLVLWKVRRIISNIEGARRYRELNQRQDDNQCHS